MVTVMFAVLGGCAAAPNASTPSPAADAAQAAYARELPAGKEATLKAGMTAAEVKGIMGEPAEISPVQSPAGKAERWMYYRTTHGASAQVQVGMSSTPTSTMYDSNGKLVVLKTLDVPIYKMQTEYFDETINLLMYDGRFVQYKRIAKSRLLFD